LVEQLKPLARERGWTLGQFALAWVLSNKTVTSAILGSSKPEHIAEGVRYVGERLSAEELAAVDEICRANP
jgi:aryl-alcohol dehydrogenase-like predicted oxidoreductase